MKYLKASILCFAVALLAFYFISCAEVKIVDQRGHVGPALEVYGRITRLWPHLTLTKLEKPGNIRIVDTKYYIPTYAEAQAIIHWQKDFIVWVQPEFVPEAYDCDDFAIETLVGVHKAFGGKYPIAFGLIDVPGHSMNILVCEEGILIYDPTIDVIRNATKEDKPFFIRI